MKKTTHGIVDIAHNVKMIEWLKCELLSHVSKMFKTLAHGIGEETQAAVGDGVANIVAIGYLLAKRLGVSYLTVDNKILGKMQNEISEKHELEERHGDMTELVRHINATRIK